MYHSMRFHAFHIGNIFFLFFIYASACNNERWNLLFWHAIFRTFYLKFQVQYNNNGI